MKRRFELSLVFLLDMVAGAGPAARRNRTRARRRSPQRNPPRENQGKIPTPAPQCT